MKKYNSTNLKNSTKIERTSNKKLGITENKRFPPRRPLRPLENKGKQMAFKEMYEINKNKKNQRESKNIRNKESRRRSLRIV